MKFLKGFISSLLGFIMLISLTTFCSLFVLRSLLSGPNLAKIFTSVVQKTNEVDLSSITKSDVNFELEGIDRDFLEEDAMQVYGELVSQMLEYEVGVREELPDTKALKEKMSELAKEYEKKTGEEIDLSEMEEEIDKAVEAYGEESKQNSIFTDDQKQIFSVIYSNTILYICIIIFIICAILIVIINKSILPLLGHLVAVLAINGVGNGLIGTALKGMISNDTEVASVIINNIGGIFNKILIISIIVALVLLVIFIIIKILKKKKEQVPLQPEYPEQRDVIDEIRATSEQQETKEQFFNPNNNNMQ